MTLVIVGTIVLLIVGLGMILWSMLAENAEHEEDTDYEPVDIWENWPPRSKETR